MPRLPQVPPVAAWPAPDATVAPSATGPDPTPRKTEPGLDFSCDMTILLSDTRGKWLRSDFVTPHPGGNSHHQNQAHDPQNRVTFHCRPSEPRKQSAVWPAFHLTHYNCR